MTKGQKRKMMTALNPCHGCVGFHFKANCPLKIKKYFQCRKMSHRQSCCKSKQRRKIQNILIELKFTTQNLKEAQTENT